VLSLFLALLKHLLILGILGIARSPAIHRDGIVTMKPPTGSEDITDGMMMPAPW
jgi:hypothetical protein